MSDLTESRSNEFPGLPALETEGGLPVPITPLDLPATGISPEILSDLALKHAYTVPQFTTEWAARRLHLPQTLVGTILEQQRSDHLLDILGSSGPFGFRYAISGRGRERAARLLDVSGYVGPAPISLDAYSAMMAYQLAQAPEGGPEDVNEALADLVLTEEARRIAGLAISSGRSLFVHGPAGNGKTTLGRALHRALRGDLWIPYCIHIDQSIIRVYDSQVHQAIETPNAPTWNLDQRWIRVRRPLIVAGGELTLESFQLAYSPSLRYYEAPIHVKANGGTFLIDDFGRQQVDPHELLNRWIIPLENRIDYLSLHTGQKIQVPFLMSLIIATNLDPQDVTDPAFLRRLGYRLCLEAPSEDCYKEIFQRYARSEGVEVPPGLLERLVQRYQTERRELRACEPRDLIERIRDICRFQGRPFALDETTLEWAWSGYFGVSRPEAMETPAP